MKCYMEKINIAILTALLVLSGCSQAWALFDGAESGNVGTDWTNTGKNLHTTGSGTFDNDVAVGGDTTLTGDLTVSGAVTLNTTKFNSKVVRSDYDYTSLAEAISSIGDTPTRLFICQDNIVADGTTITQPSTLTFDFTCGGSIDGVAGGGTETYTSNGPVIKGVTAITGANITATFSIPTSINVGTIDLLRNNTGAIGSTAVVLGYYISGDYSGGSVRIWKTGAPGTYVDNDGDIIVPTGGDGSGAWVWASYGADISVKEFGCKGDGVTDDTSCAISAMNVAIDKGAYLYFPKGTYLITGVNTYGAFYSGSSTLKIRGDGQFNTTLKNTSATGVVVNLSGTSCELLDISIDNDLGSGTAFGVYGQYSKVRRVRVQNGTGRGIDIDGATLSDFEDIQLTNTGNIAIDMGRTLPTGYVTFRRVNISPGSGIGLKMRQSVTCKFYDLHFEPTNASAGVEQYLDMSGCDQINFYGLSAEFTEPVLINSIHLGIADSDSINFFGGRIRHDGAASSSIFKISGAGSSSLKFDGLNILSTEAGMALFNINATSSCNGLAFKNIRTEMAQVAVGISTASATSGVLIENWNDTSQVCSNSINSSNLKISNFPGSIALTTATNQILENCTGTITGTGSPTCARIPELLETVSTSIPLSTRGFSNVTGDGGAISVTLADGSIRGQIKTIYCQSVVGGNVTLTVASHETSSPEVFTFNTSGDSLTLQWVGGMWVTLHNNGVTVP